MVRNWTKVREIPNRDAYLEPIMLWRNDVTGDEVRVSEATDGDGYEVTINGDLVHIYSTRRTARKGALAIMNEWIETSHD